MTLWAGWTVEQQFTLQPGETYWFDLSAMGIPGTVNADTAQAGGSSLGLPDATMHYVPFTYAGTAEAYVLNSASSGKSNASDLASAETEKSGLYGYNYPHSLFIAQHNVTHSVSWDSLNKEGFIFGKDYSSGGVHYMLRAPSVGSHDDYNYFGRYAEPENNEWNSIFNDSTQDYDDNSGGWIKNWAGQYSWGQDTFRYSTDGTERIVRGLRTADTIVIVPMSAGSQGADAAQYGYRPVLEVLNAGVLGKDGLKAVALALNGGSIGGQQEIRMVVKNGAAFTAPGGSGLTAPQGLEAANLYWLGSNGKSYSPGTSVPAEVTTLTAQWTTGHSHCICGGAAYDGHTTCTDVTWLPWAADDSLPTTGGHYYLLQDVTLTAEQEISSSLHLCLNGKTVRYGGSSGETPITVGSSGALSVYDCAGTGRMEAFVSVQGALTAVGGRISGGTSVQVQPDAALTLTGRAGNDGTITVSAGADFLMEGSAENSGTIQFMQPTDQGRVFRGQADSSGGTVELRQPAQGAGLQICGQARLGNITCADPGLVLNVEKTAAICGVMDVGESSVSGTVTCSGELRSGIFRGDVVNNGRITGGIFYGTVTGSGTIEESAKVTLSFRTDGSPVPAEQRILRGQKAAVPEKPGKNGYIFGGWYLGGALYDFDTPVLTEVQLEAGWTVRSGYSVLFDTDGGSAAADRSAVDGQGAQRRRRAHPQRLAIPVLAVRRCDRYRGHHLRRPGGEGFRDGDHPDRPVEGRGKTHRLHHHRTEHLADVPGNAYLYPVPLRQPDRDHRCLRQQRVRPGGLLCHYGGSDSGAVDRSRHARLRGQLYPAGGRQVHRLRPAGGWQSEHHLSALRRHHAGQHPAGDLRHHRGRGLLRARDGDGARGEFAGGAGGQCARLSGRKRTVRAPGQGGRADCDGV